MNRDLVYPRDGTVWSQYDAGDGAFNWRVEHI